MAIFKCKMCGASIEIINNEATCECEYCGTIQTMPQVQDNNKLISLHNRANTLRLKCDFDKALSTYENIISENEKDAEAHFGLLLCKYGIEYVDDPKTGKKIPTCHRTIAKSIFDDIDYQEAINNSDVVARRIYEEEANRIDLIQKSILSISMNEKPYDIFICYKETDDSGKRTKDSVIAQELYEELVKKGYKVFFSRITLESKLGREYEPYIYAALTSSKVMLVIGSKIEYFNAVWVKNEWSRFLGFMENDKNKYIIPCYKDLDAYDLPDELLSFQSQDMSKLGFMQDLLRGIDKLISREKNSLSSQNIEISNNHRYVNDSNGSYNLDSLLTRADILIQDIDYKNKDSNYLDAQGIVKEVLKLDPKNAKAYVCLTLIDLQLNEEKDLNNCRYELLNNKNFKWAIKFANDDYKQVLESYLNKVNQNIENDRCEKIYQDALVYMNDKNYVSAIKKFETIINYKDSKERIDICNKKEKDRKKTNKIIRTVIISIVSVAIIVCVILITISRVNNSRYSDFTFNITNDSMTIESYNGELVSTLEIPKYVRIDLKKYKVIGIGDNAFSDCTSLTSITIPDSVTSIGEYAFYNCTSLTNITIPNSVTKIGEYAFRGCTSLTSITIPDSITSISYCAFYNCTSLTNITIPDSVTSIGIDAFRSCTSLTSITIPNSVTKIGEYAFRGCTSLTSITIPNSVISMGDWVFADCSGLEIIVIPKSVTSIGNNAFYCCNSLTIYCEAESKPSGWLYYWNPDNRPVEWGYIK